MPKTNEENPLATAFISCSLRSDDRPFVEFVEKILRVHRIEPIGTVGLFSAAPTNPAEHMKKNIEQADFVVIVATKRYMQNDLKTGKQSNGLPEMVHVEAGMAYMANKPVVAFVEQGTDVGGFLPNVTQYITLTGEEADLASKWNLITSLIENTYDLVKKAKNHANGQAFLKILTGGLAVFGGIKLVQSLTSENKPKKKQNIKRKRR